MWKDDLSKSGSKSTGERGPRSPVRVFVSYRRDDVPDATDRLAISLIDRLGRDQVFLDVDDIEIGAPFADVVQDWVARCDVLLAVIGRDWVDATDEDGARRLEDPGDYVRLEIEAGLARGIRVVPILMHGARIPKTTQLPDSLVPLLERSAVELSRAHWDFDVDKLAAALERIGAGKLQTVVAGREQPEREQTLNDHVVNKDAKPTLEAKAHAEPVKTELEDVHARPIRHNEPSSARGDGQRDVRHAILGLLRRTSPETWIRVGVIVALVVVAVVVTLLTGGTDPHPVRQNGSSKHQDGTTLLGTTPTTGSRADIPSCPGNPCLGITQTTGFQTTVGSTHNPLVVPHNGSIVAWTITLAKPTTTQIEFFNADGGGPAEAGIAILRTVPKADNTYRLIAQSPTVKLQSHFGKTIRFPLEHALAVRTGDVVALSVPTWAPAMALRYGHDTTWRASRPHCTRTTQSTQTHVGTSVQYYCLYEKARLTYSATLNVTPG